MDVQALKKSKEYADHLQQILIKEEDEKQRQAANNALEKENERIRHAFYVFEKAIKKDKIKYAVSIWNKYAGYNTFSKLYQKENSLLHLACANGAYKCASFLINHNCDTNKIVSDRSPLEQTLYSYSCRKGSGQNPNIQNYKKVLKLLARHGVDLNERALNYASPIFYDAIENKGDFTPYLLELGCHVLFNSYDRPASNCVEEHTMNPDRLALLKTAEAHVTKQARFQTYRDKAQSDTVYRKQALQQGRQIMQKASDGFLNKLIIWAQLTALNMTARRKTKDSLFDCRRFILPKTR